MTTYRKKLIEVAIPLDAINLESARDKKLSSGHPTTLHYWWAPRPLAACRAVVFASLVDDPSSHPELFPSEEDQARERTRLFRLMEQLILWENRNNAAVQEAARREIAASTGEDAPILYDPFCGRGLIPHEGQRLGLDVIATDLNPIPVTIAKTLLEIVPTFLHTQPVNPEARKGRMVGTSGVAEGFANDIDFYAGRVLERIRPTIEPFYPTYHVGKELVAQRKDLAPVEGMDLTVMGWLWARSVKCSNPACGCTIPLVGSFWLSQKEKRKYWIEPEVERTSGVINFRICSGNGSAPPPTKLPDTGGTFKCLACSETSDDNYVEEQGKAGKIGKMLMACIADGGRKVGRVYLPATPEHERIALSANPSWRPDLEMPDYSQAMPTVKHGVKTWGDMFTDRQILTLDALAGGIRDLHDEVLQDAIAAGMANDGKGVDAGGIGAKAYAEGIMTFMTLVLGKFVNRCCAFCFWHTGGEKIEQPFAQQGIQKSWDFIESNLLCESSGSWIKATDYPVKVIKELYGDIRPGRVRQQQVAEARKLGKQVMVVTDPPYYDNMGYADLSDFFYIWERRALKEVFPLTFGTLQTPKLEELAAMPQRFEGVDRKAQKKAAEAFFIKGFQEAFQELAAIQRPDYPLVLFYAYKQKETKKGETTEVSTGWETMLRGLVESGLQVTATWPMLSESTDTIKKGKSSLSTSIVLACRPRAADAHTGTRRELLNRLREELPKEIRLLQANNIAPVDLAQASLGTGMAVFSSFAKVVEPDGTTMTVRNGLAIIQQELDGVLAAQEGDFDGDTRWAVTWFEQHGFEEGPYGVAETLSTARNTSVEGLVEAGFLWSKAGKVRLLKREELPTNWDPEKDIRLTVWESVQHLIRVLESEGEAAAGHLLLKLGPLGDVVRELAYRLYALCERKKWSQEAQAYNGLIVSWGAVSTQASNAPRPATGKQGSLDLED
jgi:putative DNA methylase